MHGLKCHVNLIPLNPTKAASTAISAYVSYQRSGALRCVVAHFPASPEDRLIGLFSVTFCEGLKTVFEVARGPTAVRKCQSQPSGVGAAPAP